MPLDSTPLPVTNPEIEFLESVYKLLSGTGKWCQGTFARNEYGKEVHILDDDAYSFCILGAARYINHHWGSFAGEKTGLHMEFATNKIIRLLGFDYDEHGTIEDWNDTAKSKAVILRRITKHIKLLRAQLIEETLRDESPVHSGGRLEVPAARD